MMHHLDGMGDGTRAKSLAILTAPVISIFRQPRLAEPANPMIAET